MSARAMAGTSQPMATHTALEILHAGGNALDAAIAAAAVLGVTEPYSTSIGGDCFLLYHEAATGKLHALNGSGRAPARATAQAIRERGFERMPATGMLSVTVPGAIDAWATAHDALGRLSFAELLQPAIGYAADGFAVTPVVATNWQQSEAQLRAERYSAQAYLVDDRAPRAGEIHRQPRLAESLRAIAAGGRDAFYLGEIAAEIVRVSDELGGLLSREDLAEHRSEWVEPISTRYQDLVVYEVPPNGQGITTLMALNILSEVGLSDVEFLSTAHVHRVADAVALAMAERDRFVSDMHFNELPIDELLSAEFAREQASRLSDRALSLPVRSQFPQHRDTVYISVVDEQRNACSFINSTFASWGSGVVAGNTGISLQNRGSGFVLDEGHFNCIEPRKRPLHTIIPAMVYRDQRPVLCFGVMGGQYQAMGQTYVLSNWAHFGLDLQQAIDAPRFYIYDGVLIVEQGISEASRAELGAMGHEVVVGEKPLGGGQAIYIDWNNGTLHGASDPRKDGCALGY